MASLAFTLRQIKDNPRQFLDPKLIARVCDRLGYHWRQRELDPATTIGLFIQQILHGNTPCSEIRHLAHQDFSASAWCQARARLPLPLYQSLLQQIVQTACAADSPSNGLWRGHRTFHIDGTSFSMSDTPALRSQFGQPTEQKPGCGFPVAHLMVLFNARTGLLMDAIPACWKRGELADLPQMLRHLRSGDILLGDESFGGFVVLALLLRGEMHGLFPVPHARIVDFTAHRPFVGEGRRNPQGRPYSRWIRSLGKLDQVVEYFKPRGRPKWMSPELFAALPPSIVVRELRRTIDHPQSGPMQLTMVTTLTNAKAYPARALVQLRQSRWAVETNIGHLKTTMRMDVLRCKTVAGVRKELCIFALVYNLVRLVMLEAGRRQGVAVQRVSFADTLKWLRHARPGERLPRLIVNPSRPHRLEPRVKKRRAKPYPLMNKPRAAYKPARQPRAGKR
jgi:hypothetical protein